MRLPILAYIPILFMIALSGCADDPKAKAGDSCESGAECASGVCFQQQCLSPNGAACEAASECASGSCVKNLCASIVTPDITEFFFFAPQVGLEDNSSGGAFLPAISYSESFGITKAGLTPGAECMSLGLVRRGDENGAPLRTSVYCEGKPDGDESFPYVSGPASMTLAFETEAEINESGNLETRDAHEIRIIATGDQTRHPAESDVLIGQVLRNYLITNESQANTRGREVETLLFVRHSKNMQPAAAQGDWGFVAFTAHATADPAIASFVSSHFANTIAADGTGLSLTTTASMDFSVTQPLSGSNGEPITTEQHERGADAAVPVQLKASGEVVIDAGDAAFKGAVSPNADFMMLYQSSPPAWPPFEGEDPIHEPNAATTSFTFMWGVKRAADPVATLAGKRYRLLRFAVRAESGRFVIIHSPGQPTLDFDATASGAALTATEHQIATSFAGGLFPETTTIDRPTLTVTPGHAESFALIDAGQDSSMGHGYVSADGRNLIFAHGTERLNANGEPLGATTGLIFGVCTNCDSAVVTD